LNSETKIRLNNLSTSFYPDFGNKKWTQRNKI